MASIDQSTISRLLEVLKTDMSDPLASDFTKETLSSPPFISIDGIFNLRDSSCHAIAPSSALRPAYAFRSGSLEKLLCDSYGAVKNLGIRSIFDLRSLKETTEFPDPPIEGVEVISVPSTLENETTVQAQKSQQEKDDHSLIGMYMTVLATHRAIYKVVLQHVRDHPDRPFLFHCAAGKDRTAVLAYLLHGLAGSPMEVISLDYALTRVGIEPVREFLTDKLTGGGKVALKDPRIAPYANVPVDGMIELDRKVKEKYGSVEQYAETVLELAKPDIDLVKKTFRDES